MQTNRCSKREGRAGGWDARLILPVVLLFGCGGSTTSDTGRGGSPAVSGGAGVKSPSGGAGTGTSTRSGAGTGGPLPSNAGAGGHPAAGSGVVATAGKGGGAGTTAGGGGKGGATGTGGSTGPTTYPMLEASKIGAPMMISSAFTLAEGPLWDRCNHRLLFADVQGGGGSGTIHALDSSGQITVFMMNTGNTNGFAFDIDGSLILAQMGPKGAPGHISRRDSAGMVKIIDPAGSPAFHTPDDVIVRSDGTIYFTDGDFYPIGNLLGASNALPVYQITPGSAKIVNGGTVSGPNGIELSPDEKTLYVNGYGDGSVWTFSVAADGSLTKGTALASGLSSADSLCLDAAGNLYVGVSSGLQVLRADGSMVTTIPVTGVQATTNCTFGGDDGKTLYITAWTQLLKVDNMPIPGLDWTVNQTRLTCN